MRTHSKATIEDSLALDAGSLMRQRVLRPIHRGAYVLTWHNIDDEEQASIRLEVDVGRGEGRAVARYRLEGVGEAATVLRLTAMAVPRGGLRWLFLCPHCNARSAILYLPPSTTTFACRTCHSLIYTSSKQSHCGDRYIREFAKAHGKTLQEIRLIASAPWKLQQADHVATRAT